MNIDLAFYWKLFWRRLPVMTVFILACSTLGVITALKLPETWSTSAKLLVEAPQISDDLVQSTIETGAVEQLDIIQNKLLTRANLIDIASRFNVFENIQDMEPDRVVQQMRQATSIRRTAGRNQATLMTLSFTGRSGRVASDVVNEYITLVLQENIEIRTAASENTLEFFEQEVDRLSKELDQQSASIAVFKADNISALPEDQGYRLGRQALLQERLSRIERDLNIAQSQRKDIVDLFQSTGTTRPQTTRPQSTEQRQLVVAEAELEQALSIYSDSHPRVTRLDRRVERLKAIVAAQIAATQDILAETESLSPERAVLEATLAEIDTRLEFLASDAEKTRSELETLQQSISRSSVNGIELGSLERDYDNIQARYNVAVANLNTAQMSDRREKSAKGQRITVIENANIPRVPAGPNRTRIAMMGAALGFALAGGYFMLLELLNRSVRRPSELVGRFNITPITVIPYMESKSERFFRRSGILAATTCIAIGVPAGLWYIDTQYLPLELVVQRGLERFGLS